MEFRSEELENLIGKNNERISVSEITVHNYISTENMIVNKSGVLEAANLPSSKTVKSYKKGDILISNIRPYFKKIWLADRDGGASNDVLVFRTNPDILDNSFLYYYLSQDIFFEYMVQTSKGTKMPRGDKNAIKKYNIHFPEELKHQRKIAHIGVNIDKKILNNNKIIANLEELALALFKRWFIDFEFPDKNGEPYKSNGGHIEITHLVEVPKGWSIVNLADLCEVKDGTHDSPKQQKTGYPLVTSKHLMKNFIDLNNAKLISEEDYLKVNKRSQVHTNDILISMIGTVGRLYFVYNRDINFAIKNIGLIKSSQLSNPEYVYLYFNSPSIKNYIETRSAGSTQQYISLTNLRKTPILCPPKDLLEKFTSIIQPWFEYSHLASEEISKLHDLRDTLLPKLMSGEIELPEALEV